MAPGARSKFGAPVFETEVFRKQMYCIEESTCRAGPSRCGAQCKSYARGVSEQWCYDVIVLIQPCYDLFDEDVLSKSKTVAMYAHDKQFLLFVGE